MNASGSILGKFLAGGPLTGEDIVDCHAHMGPALYMMVPDSDADGLVRNLDALGVDLCCVAHTVGMVSDWYVGNTLLMEAVRKYPGRIFGYAFFNPRYPADMDAEMSRCAAGGLNGLKIHPDFHRVPADSPLYAPLYERAQAQSRLTLCHYDAGHSALAGAHLYRGVVGKFPKIPYIMAHSLGSRAAVDCAVEYFGGRENVSFDLSDAFTGGVIEYAVTRLGADRLLFGTDGCWGSMATRLGMVCATDLPDGVKRKILGTNMRRLLSGYSRKK